MVTERVDLAIIGGGPAGQLAASTAAQEGLRVVLIEQERQVGGECVRRGTIPSKTLRETALALSNFRKRSGGVVEVSLGTDVQLESLMTRKGQVIDAHHAFLAESLAAEGVEVWHGRARFLEPRLLAVLSVGGQTRLVEARGVIIATGSRPRTPPDVPVDHEHVLDSDSVLSMAWLPRSLTVLGSGVIASEYASIFSTLGVQVTMVDRAERPLSFLDDELSAGFVRAFEAQGGRSIGGRRHTRVTWNGVDRVITTLDDGTTIESEKLLCALGRTANVERLDLARAGVSTSTRGLIPVDEALQTSTQGVYAVGDVIGPPSLASSSMEQGRRAVRHFLGQAPGPAPELIPAGVYTIPELSSVGLTEPRPARATAKSTSGEPRSTASRAGRSARPPKGSSSSSATPRAGGCSASTSSGRGPRSSSTWASSRCCRRYRSTSSSTASSTSQPSPRRTGWPRSRSFAHDGRTPAQSRRERSS
jgi:NAD(P) transhydrogenase